jgi:hypothetical protein
VNARSSGAVLANAAEGRRAGSGGEVKDATRSSNDRVVLVVTVLLSRIGLKPL